MLLLALHLNLAQNPAAASLSFSAMPPEVLFPNPMSWVVCVVGEGGLLTTTLLWASNCAPPTQQSPVVKLLMAAVPPGMVCPPVASHARTSVQPFFGVVAYSGTRATIRGVTRHTWLFLCFLAKSLPSVSVDNGFNLKDNPSQPPGTPPPPT